MEKKQSYKLIDGEFDPSEARNVLFVLVNSKINFHSRTSFAIKERTSGDTSFHEKRKKELEQTNIDLRKVLEYAEKNKLRLRIDGNIEIKLIDESTDN